MELKITDKKENSLLDRVEVSGTILFEGATPSNFDVVAAVAKELKSEAGLVVAKHIYTKFSHQEANFQVVVYKNAEAKAKAERVTKHMKKKAEEAKKAEAEKKKDETTPEEGK